MTGAVGAPLPLPLRLGAAAVLAQAGGLGLAGAGLAGGAVVGEPESIAGTLVTAGVCLVVAVGLVAAARALRAGSARVRGPLVAVELIAVLLGAQLALALPFPELVAGVAVLVAALVGSWGLLHPQTSAALLER